MVKIAILCTGQYRTFDKTYKVIYDNLIGPNDGVAFMYIESSYSSTELTDIARARWGEQYVGTCETVTSTRTEEFKEILAYLLRTKPAIQVDKFTKVGWSQDYVVKSGSILEYYQFMKCYELLLNYEKSHGMEFDYVIRYRLDIIFNQPLYLQRFFTSVDEELRAKYSDDIYIRSLGNENMARLIRDEIKDSPDWYIYTVIDRELGTRLSAEEILAKINNDNHLWVFGINQVWITSHSQMNKMYPLIYWYGTYDTGKDFTFNSETQFAEYCKYHNIKVYYYFTAEDDMYLGNMNLNHNVISGTELMTKDNPNFMMTIIRG